MIPALIKWSIDNRFLVLLLTTLLLGTGIYAVKETPLDAIPDLSDVQVIVRTNYPGQAPQVVEDQVTYPLTTAMMSVPKATTVRGLSFFGDSYVYILFEDNTDLYWARSRVLEYLNQVTDQLPEGVRPALGPDATGVGWIYQYALKDTSGTRNLADLTSIQNWFLRFELQTVPGVSEVATVGGLVRQYQVVLDPSKMRIFNLTFAEVRNAIREANGEVGGSVVELAEAEYLVRAKGYIKDLDDLRQIPISMPINGTPLLLKDVADISVGPQIRRAVGELNGEGEAVGSVVIIRSGENALKTIAAVKNKLEEIQSGLPEGVEVITTYDRSGLINRAVDNLSEKLVEEFIVVALACALFLLHFRSSLVIVLTLPLGILAAFIVMYMQGINANIMSLGGIAIAIGAMVDAAIVMIEALHRRLEKEALTEDNRWRIVKQVCVEVGPALFFSLIIITVSFMPVFALEAQEGRLFKPLAFTKTYAMAAAAILSITLVPVLMGYFIRGKMKPETSNPLNRILLAGYRAVLNVTLAAPKTALVVALLATVSAAYPLNRLGSEFMPDLNEGDFLYMPVAFPGVSIGKSRELVQQTNKLIMTVPEVQSVYGKSGRALTATDPAPLTMTETNVQLKPRSEWREGMTIERIRAELDRIVNVPGLTNAWVMPIKGRIDMLATGIRTPIGIKVSGEDLNVIDEIGETIEFALRDLPGTSSVYAERVVGGRYLEVDIRRADAARYGMSVAAVQDVVRSAIGGAVVSQSVEGLERYPINLRFPRSVRDSVEDLGNLPIVTPTGAHIPLKTLVDINLVDGPGMIRSENARLSGWVFIDITGIDVGTYVANAKERLNTFLTIPPGYSIGWSGQFEYIERAKERLSLIIPVTLILIVLVLFLVFRRFMDVAIVMLSLPLALTGSFWFLYLLGYNLSIAVAVGMIALAGVAVETGVVMLVFLHTTYKDHKKDQKTPFDLKAAVMDGALLRLRPIMMTVITVIVGLIPIMYGTGTGSEVMQRIAAPMVGGMITATVLTLIVIPAVFYLWMDKSR
ncbi:efflux RND transporter permease subunit [Kordiimonas sp. SCSIO 12610]|uniref:efflux RND transporter permease subunit n=1 Tax=Kordiimonas sp. SCSIO 12610 TaxID=2829597 RepID=UPI00210D4449|nr:CusA/CzcA family heavy metal efflux RND transporter [Kordiimonas sp. SCSIO 12610]UTW54659.1 efflux RND transporter permease subunit [Kordiimonas sp. SCSIO 12610]